MEERRYGEYTTLETRNEAHEQIDKGKKKFKKTGKKKLKKKKKGMPIKISQQMTLVEDNNKIKKQEIFFLIISSNLQ